MAYIRSSFPSGSDAAFSYDGVTINRPQFNDTTQVDNGLTLDLIRTDLQVAPDFVGLDLTPTTQLLDPLPGLTIYDRHFHEDWFEVDWGDSNATPYITDSMPTQMRDRNLSLHTRSGHVYDTPGTYTITARRYRDGQLISENATQVTVNDPDEVFGAAQTCVVSAVSDFTDAPAHDHTRTQLTNALNWASNQSLPSRVLVHAGEDFELDNRIVRDYHNLYLGTYGTGAKPVLKPAASGSGLLRVYEQQNIGSVVWGFNLQGNWDSRVENVLPGTTRFGDGIRSYGDGFLVVHDCDASGFEAAFGCNAETALNRVVVSQSTITNWQDYGIFLGSANGNRAWLLGVKINQDVDALSGGRGKVSGPNFAGNDHGPLRCQAQHLTLECVETFSRNAWTASAVADDQDGMRLHMNGPTRTICGNRILCEGGLKAYADGAAANSVKNGMNIRITNLIHLGNYTSKVGVDVSNGGTTLENLFLLRSDNRQATGIQNNAIVLRGATSANNDRNENNSSPVRIRNPTVVNLMGDTNAGSVGFTPVSDLGNFSDAATSDLVALVVRTNGAVNDGPFDQVALRPPLYKGQRFGYDYIQTTLPNEVPDQGTVTFPYPSGMTQADGFAAGWTQASIAGAGNLDTKDGEIVVTFEPAGYTIQNTNGTTWAAGANVTLKLDRRNSPRPYTDATPAGSYDLYHPAHSNSAVVGQASGDATPRRDLLMRVRPTLAAKGALEPQ